MRSNRETSRLTPSGVCETPVFTPIGRGYSRESEDVKCLRSCSCAPVRSARMPKEGNAAHAWRAIQIAAGRVVPGIASSVTPGVTPTITWEATGEVTSGIAGRTALRAAPGVGQKALAQVAASAVPGITWAMTLRATTLVTILAAERSATSTAGGATISASPLVRTDIA